MEPNSQPPKDYVLANFIEQSQSSKNEINLYELFQILWKQKWKLVLLSSLFFLLSIFVVIQIPNEFRATTILTPSTDSASSLSNLAGQLGGLASLAGVNLGVNDNDNTNIAIEIMQSRYFLEEFIQEHDLTIPLMAVQEWDYKTNQLIIDPSIYDESTQQWVREVSPPLQAKPSPWEVYQQLLDRLSISYDKSNAVISITLDYYSPQLAKEWLALLINKINQTMRFRDKEDAQNSLNYLTSQSEVVQVGEMRKVIFQLIEEQMKLLMLTEVNQEYVMKVIEPANVPDKKHKPHRTLIILLTTFFGSLLSVLFFISAHVLSRQ